MPLNKNMPFVNKKSAIDITKIDRFLMRKMIPEMCITVLELDVPDDTDLKCIVLQG